MKLPKYSNPNETHQEIEDEEKLVAELKAKAAPSKLEERLAELDATDGTVPPG